MKQSKLFGTDGIRGVAGEYPLDAQTVFIIGRALGHYLREHEAQRVLIGEDTRESSHWIAETLAAGLDDEGVTTVSAGVIPTAGVAYLARTDGFSAGVMISASHNPYQDNGIKVFAHSGYKLPDADELAVEEAIFRMLETHEHTAEARRKPLTEDSSLRTRYEDYLCSRWPTGVTMRNMHLVMDCANGASSRVAPDLFRRLGADVVAINAVADGRNINRDAGSLHPEKLQARVPAERAIAGVAFDGDADRALFVTASGELVNGDGVLYLAARHMLDEKKLRNCLVVGTVMANLGLEVALKKSGIELLRTPVGDKYVLEEMLARGANLGGEQSGHIIFSDDHTTGDGLLTALRVLEIVAVSGKPLQELAGGLRVFPQVLLNVRVREKVPVERLPEVQKAIEESEKHFGGEGRIVVRYSGTEALARIMVEGPDLESVERHAGAIAREFQKAIGL